MQRFATFDDLSTIQEIERAAGAAFRTLGMETIAEDEPIGATAFEAFLEKGGAWVTAADDDSVIAYLLVEQLDTALHVEQITVHPRVARRGIGAKLLDVADERAVGIQLGSLTLTTFRDVPWNAPYYARLGFGIFPQEQWGPRLQQRVALERTGGLDKWPRVVMHRPVN